MEEVSFTGGARIGWVNASWPLARLVASPRFLRIRVLWDSYSFAPSEVVSLERYGWLRFLAAGIRIAHARSDYPRKIIFWYPGNPDVLLDGIRGVGFLPAAPASSEVQWRGFPIRWAAVVLSIAIWNGLFYLGDIVPGRAAHETGLIALIPLLAAFLFCWRTKTSSVFQKMVLRDGHSVSEIRPFLSLVQTVSGMLLVIFAVLILTRTLR